MNEEIYNEMVHTLNNLLATQSELSELINKSNNEANQLFDIIRGIEIQLPEEDRYDESLHGRRALSEKMLDDAITTLQAFRDVVLNKQEG